jgi:hypothetical protein
MPKQLKLGVDGAQDSEVREEIIERYKAVDQHYKDWNDAAEEDYKMALGDQWSEDDKKTLDAAGRPCLTFNRIRPLINLVSGYQRENAARIKVNPEGGEDRIFSEVMDKAIRFIDKNGHLSYKLGYLFDDGCYCGKGFLEAIITYEKDPIRGEIQFKQRHYADIKPDPECREYDMNEGANYLFKIVKLTKEKLIELYPKQKKIIEGFVEDTDDIAANGSGTLGSEDDYGLKGGGKGSKVKDSESDEGEGSELEKDEEFTVKEYWRPKMVEKFFVINKKDGEPERFDDEIAAKAFSTSQRGGKVIKRKIPEMWVATFVCGFVIQDIKSPFEPHYSGYPFFRFIADWAPNAKSEVLRVQGITRPLKDPQKEKNKSKSQYLHILNTQANSGWVADSDALTEPGFKKLEEMGSKPGIVIRKKAGKELREILPKGPNQGHLQREQLADEEFKQISGINPDLMGFQEGTASGRAISMRIKQAILALVRLFTNYRYSKEIIGKFLLEMMPMLFDAKKLMKVLGPAYMAKAVDPEKYPEGLSEGSIEAFLTMVKDNKYDVYVTEADQNATVRYETFQELSELLKNGAPIPVDLLIDYMDLPNSEEIKQKIKEQQAAQAAAAGTAKGGPGA